jgi:DNA invertase Pin-like site-specific DNA recombinase
MMTDKKLTPSNPDGVLRAIEMGRLSKAKESEDETEATIESSYKAVEEFLSRVYKGKLHVRQLGEQISGLVADRATILEAYELIATGEWDVVLTEDLSRLYRNPRHQMIFVQDCVDAGVRFISVADNLDTADESWEMMLGVSTLRHGFHVPDTRRRVKRKAKYSFHNGGMVLKVKYSYVKVSKQDAKSGKYGPVGLCIRKLDKCTPVIAEIRERLMTSRDPLSIVDWLNDNEVPPGPYVTSGRWSLWVLKGLLCDPILHGLRTFRRTTYQPIYSSGKHRRKWNPEPETEHWPQLAHMTREEQEEMLAAVGWEINWNGIKPKAGGPRLRISRYDSLWPGQAATCGACEGPMLICGDHLRCKWSLKQFGQSCWNHVQVPIALTRERLLAWLREQLSRFFIAREAMVATAWEVYRTERQKRAKDAGQICKEIKSYEAQQQAYAKAIGLAPDIEVLVEKLKGVEEKLQDLHRRLQNDEQAAVEFELTKDGVSQQLDVVLAWLLNHSFEFAETLRECFPKFVIQPVMALDTPQVRPRGRLCFSLTRSPDACQFAEVVFDLFKVPEHITHIPNVVAARNRVPRPSYQQIAEELGINRMTVKRALAYAKLMEMAGASEPYRELSSKPQNAARWRS